MPYNRKKYKKSTAISALRRMAYRSKIQAKLSKLNTCDIFWSARMCNNIDAGKGAVELSDRVQGTSSQDSLPLVVIPFRNIINGGETGGGVFRLKQNGYDFTKIADMEFAGMKGNVKVVPGADCEFSTLLHRYTDLKLLLWQNTAKDVKFQIRLVVIKDETLNPLNITEANADYQKIKRQFYYYHLLRHQLSNPILENTENYLQEIKSRFKIIWSKEYNIAERHGQIEQSHYQQIKIFRKFDRLIDYANSPRVDGSGVDNNPDQIKYVDVQENPTSTPITRDNLFLIITANATKSDADANPGYDAMTFDLALKSKYTLPVDQVY